MILTLLYLSTAQHLQACCWLYQGLLHAHYSRQHELIQAPLGNVNDLHTESDTEVLLQTKPDAVPRACSSWMCLLLAIQDPVHPCTRCTASCHEELAAVPCKAGAALLSAPPL